MVCQRTKTDYDFVHVNVGCQVSFQYDMHGMVVGWRTSHMSFMNSLQYNELDSLLFSVASYQCAEQMISYI